MVQQEGQGQLHVVALSCVCRAHRQREPSSLALCPALCPSLLVSGADSRTLPHALPAPACPARCPGQQAQMEWAGVCRECGASTQAHLSSALRGVLPCLTDEETEAQMRQRTLRPTALDSVMPPGSS